MIEFTDDEKKFIKELCQKKVEGLLIEIETKEVLNDLEEVTRFRNFLKIRKLVKSITEKLNAD